jgi:transcriptional regulator with XRE-family HTH domain
MPGLDEAVKIGNRIRDERKLSGLGQVLFAQKLANSRDLIVRMERGENVGIHNVIAALDALGLEIQIVNKNVVAGSFNQFYEEQIGKNLISELRNNSDAYASGIFKPADKPRMRVSNWKQAAKL